MSKFKNLWFPEGYHSEVALHLNSINYVGPVWRIQQDPEKWVFNIGLKFEYPDSHNFQIQIESDFQVNAVAKRNALLDQWDGWKEPGIAEQLKIFF